MNRFTLPLIIFVAMAVLLAVGLKLNPREIPSPFIGKPAPAFSLPSLANSSQINEKSFEGEVWLFNVWASWCVACLHEHPLLMDLARKESIKFVGLNYKDQRPDAIAWLNQHGNPYDYIAVDAEGNVGSDYGVYGVPETFIIDKKGIIRLKHIGPVTEEAMRDEIVPLLSRLKAETS